MNHSEWGYKNRGSSLRWLVMTIAMMSVTGLSRADGGWAWKAKVMTRFDKAERVMTVWVKGERFRWENKKDGRTQITVYDGMDSYTFSEGDSFAFAHKTQIDVVAWKIPWASWGRKATESSQPSYEIIDGRKCRVVKFKLPPAEKGGVQPSGVEEWIWEDKEIVVRRKYAFAGKEVVVDIKDIESLSEGDEAWFQPPTDLPVKRGMPQESDFVGKPLKGFILKKVGQRQNLTLADFNGKIFLMNFFATWCGPCREEKKLMAKVYEDYKKKGVEFITVDVGESGQDQDQNERKVMDFLKEAGVKWPVLMDEQGYSREYAWGAIPTNMVIDQEGIIRAYWMGFTADDLDGSIFKGKIDKVLTAIKKVKVRN